MKVLKQLKKILIVVGDFLGTIMSTLLLTLLYFLIVGPIKLISVLAGKDFLSQKTKGDTYWVIPEDKNTDTLEKLQLPF